ncbi:hypothetical protein FJO98_14035 [Enterococcus sp. PF-2]|uniref:hypothetical protein n=1 Tax=unclassified Enterococcus TaxID=2608891 RepID=UPI001122CA2E|nr:MULTISPECIES: hypothetical protein [unclassified Enterococcus]TPE00620.1 hypothetical protein FJP08_14610 [Enterococcus sp. PF-3]TPE24195.1 hypothetical protein FJO98_14035 [Enterococcus sp. PF-2]
MMKLLTLFSAVFLLSSTAVNTTLAFQQVAYAETESLSEETQHSSTEETTNSADLSEDQETTEESSEEQSSSEATDDSTTASQEEAEENEALPEAETPDSSEDEAETEAENEQVEGFDAEVSAVALTVASESQLRAILLGESFTDEDGTEYHYEEIANDQSLVLTFANNLALTEPISGIQRTDVTFRSQDTPVIVSQTAAENLMQFAAPVQLTWQGVQQQGIQSAQGLAQTTGASTITFEDTQLELTTTAGRVVNNNQAHLHFKGTNVVTTATSSIPTLFTVEGLLVEGQLTINHRSSNATPIFEMNQVAVASQAEISVTRSTNSNTGTVFHMTGTAASLDFGQGSMTTIRQSGAMVSLPNANQDSRLTLATGATLDVGTGQGLSGDSTSTLGEVRLQAGSQLKLSEYGTVSETPAINVGHRFIVENSTADQPTIIEGTRTGTTTGAFIQLQSANSSIDFGENTQTRISQHGPMFTGVASTTIVIQDHVKMNNQHSNGFNGNVAVNSIAIGDQVDITISEPSNATVGQAYRTFFATSSVQIGSHTTIDVPRTRTTSSASTSNVVIGLASSNGKITIGDYSEIAVNQRGAFVNASLAQVTLGKYSKLTGVLGNGFTAGTLVDQFELLEGAEINVAEHSTSAAANAFSVQRRFFLGEKAAINYSRTSSAANPLIALGSTTTASQFLSEANATITLNQVGPLVTGRSTTDIYIGEANTISLQTAQGFTGGTSSAASSTIRRLHVGDHSEITVSGRSNANVDFFRFREEIKLGREAEVTVNHTTRQAARAVFRLTLANSKFTMEEASKVEVDTGGRFIQGVSTSDLVFGENSYTRINAARGMTGNTSVRSVILAQKAEVHMTEPTTSNIQNSAVGHNYARIRVAQRVELLDNAKMTSKRDRTTYDSRFIQLGNANSFVRIGKGAQMDVNQSGGIFRVTTTSNLILEDEAVFNGVARGLNTQGGGNGSSNHSNSFANITVGKRAEFFLTDNRNGMGTTAEFTNRPLVNVRNTFIADEDSTVTLETIRNKLQVLYFRTANAQLNVKNVALFEISHPTTRTGQANAQLQRLIRSERNTVANGLKINVNNQKFSVWENAALETPTEEFINIYGTMRINRNGGNPFPYGGTGSAEARSRLLSGEQLDGSLERLERQTDIYQVIAKNNYNKIRFSEPEGLVARIDALSDQSTEITGSMYEDTDITVISYTNTDGELVELDKNSERIEWGDYRDENQLYRYFRIPLRENERLETETEVSIFLSKPSIETYVDVTARQTVIKGVNFEAYNITLDRYKINELSTQEELDALILQESRAQAVNVLTEADMTDDFRIVETDLTREVDEDGSYFAVLEVGNKAYQLTVGIDVTSKLEHMRVTIPTKMVFESLYNTAESNRNFESQGYEIRNQSPLAVDTYINQLAIDDSAGIVLLEEGEDPLDYAESESEEDDPTLTYDDISTPLLRLNLKTEETQIQLYEAMEEQHLVRLAERSRVPISLTGDFYGDYPQWVVDSEADQGGYYEDLLVPNYRIVLRFVPRD